MVPPRVTSGQFNLEHHRQMVSPCVASHQFNLEHNRELFALCDILSPLIWSITDKWFLLL